MNFEPNGRFVGFSKLLTVGKPSACVVFPERHILQQSPKISVGLQGDSFINRMLVCGFRCQTSVRRHCPDSLTANPEAPRGGTPLARSRRIQRWFLRRTLTCLSLTSFNY
ncbi:hypothetical protein NPIL_183361 [Nephila pilipes]|uniref:Uncharacterized protein n=1 Tax=Nephila pilipes TaxID=299642 RepID=A0A8X6PBI7_NEPPI|nr:hypothetical protein NPIL_183361 [Nephila pilipes]